MPGRRRRSQQGDNEPALSTLASSQVATPIATINVADMLSAGNRAMASLVGLIQRQATTQSGAAHPGAAAPIGGERIRERELAPTRPADDRECSAQPAPDPLYGTGNSAISKLLAGSRALREGDVPALPTGGYAGGVVARFSAAGNGAVGRLLDGAGTQRHERVPEDFRASVAASGQGESLPEEFRAEAEASFGASFAEVRVHNDAAAANAARQASARAFTVGRDVYFAHGQYERDSDDGGQLLAHELTHVVQQSAASAQPNGSGWARFSEPGDPAEQAAEAAAQQFASGARSGSPGAAPRVPAGSGVVVARDRDPRAPNGASPDAPGGDIRTMSITPQFAINLPDDLLPAQLRTLDSHIATLTPGSAEYAAARENQEILQKEQVRRLIQGPGMSTPADTVQARHDRFQQAVLLSAQHRLTQNQENLDQWRALIETQFTVVGLQNQVLAQSAADLRATAQQTGGMPAYNAWAADPNPYRRNVEEHQARGEWRFCTGCHEIVRADALSQHEPHVGPAWTSPANRLSTIAGLPPGPPDRLAAISGADAVRVQAAVNMIRPVVAPLGDQGYRIIPDDVFSLGSGMSAEDLRTTILAKIAQRHSDYAELSARIADGQVNYLQLGPVLQDLLAAADAEVRRAVADDQAAEQVWSTVKIGATLILTLLSLVFPPAGVALAAVQLATGYQSFQQGYSYQLGTGANDVFSREQQNAAGAMMAGGLVDITQALVVLGSAWAALRGAGGPRPPAPKSTVVEPDVVYSPVEVDPNTGVVSQMAFHRPTGQYLKVSLNPATGTGEIVNLSTGQQAAVVANGAVSPAPAGLLSPGTPPGAPRPGPSVTLSTGAIQPTGPAAVDPFSGKTLGFRSASAQQPELIPSAAPVARSGSDAELSLAAERRVVDEIVDTIEERSVQRAIDDTAFMAALDRGRAGITDAGTRFHNIAKEETRLFVKEGKVPAGYSVLAEHEIGSGSGSSRIDLLVTTPSARPFETDWKTSILSGLAKSVRESEMPKHVIAIRPLFGELAGQESRSWGPAIVRMLRRAGRLKSLTPGQSKALAPWL
jgi:hypothetical protein